MRKPVSPFLFCLLFALSSPGYSHHSFAVHFVSDETVTVMGTIEDFRFTNPHGEVHFIVHDENGEEVQWRAETNSPNLLRRRGWDRDSLQSGDEVTIEGWPARNEEHYMRIRKVTFADGAELVTQTGSRPSQD